MVGVEETSKRRKKWDKDFSEKTNSRINELALILIFSILGLSLFATIELYLRLDNRSITYSSDAAALLSAFATIFLTGVTVGSLVINDRVTKKNTELNTENTRLNTMLIEQQNEPRVIIKVSPLEKYHAVAIHLTNIGNGVATKVRFSELADISIDSFRHLSDISFIKDGIDYMPPNQLYVIEVRRAWEEDQFLGEFKLSIEYCNIFGKKFHHEVQINLDNFFPNFILRKIDEAR